MTELVNYFKKAAETIPAMFLQLENYSFIIPLTYLSFVMIFSGGTYSPSIWFILLLCMAIPRIFFNKARNKVSTDRFIFKTFVLMLFVISTLLALFNVIFYHPLSYVLIVIVDIIINAAAIVFI